MSYFKPFLFGFFVAGFLIVVVGLKAEERGSHSSRSELRQYPHQNSSYHISEQSNIAYEYGFALPYYYNPVTKVTYPKWLPGTVMVNPNSPEEQKILQLKKYYFNPDTGDVSTSPQGGWKEVERDKKGAVTIRDVNPDDLP